MPPVEFNPNAKSLEVKQRNGVDKDNAVKSPANKGGEASSKEASQAATDDKFTQSETLSTLMTVDLEPTPEQAQARADKIADLKAQIENRTFPILSDDPNVRQEAALQVSEKLMDFESQLQGIGE